MRINDLFRNPFYRQCWKMLALMLGAIVLCKYSKGAFSLAIVAMGIGAASRRKPAVALICFALLPFLSILNPVTFAIGGLLSLSIHFGLPVLTLAMMSAAAARKGRQTLPLFGLWAYVLVACASSIGGYAPMISFLKIFNFILFIVGISAGTRNLDKDPRGLVKLRTFFFAFSVFIVAGSLVLNFVSPFAAHASTASWMGGDFEAADAAIREQIATTGDAGFLCGVVNHSQCLGPTAACVAGWLLLDMLLIEKRFMLGHVLTLILCPYVLFLTKSRTALLAFLAAVVMVVIYAVPKFRVPRRLKRRIVTMVVSMMLLLGLAGVILEVTSGGVRKWLIKHDAEDTDKVTMQALTATRQGQMAKSLYDFEQNPLLGKGFQVDYWHQFIRNRFVLSAPIEKGFLPTMILGETGIAGAIVFLIFLASFYGVCTKKRYFATLTLFSTYLASNLGEATFFSPGGTGGPQWLITLIGGFAIDMTTLVQRRGQGAGRGRSGLNRMERLSLRSRRLVAAYVSRGRVHAAPGLHGVPKVDLRIRRRRGAFWRSRPADAEAARLQTGRSSTGAPPQEISLPSSGTVHVPRGQGKWQDLCFFNKTVILDQLTSVFCERFVPEEDERTADQMVLDAQNGAQSIVDGFADDDADVTELNLPLLNVAQASVKELRLDYLNYLRRHTLVLWDVTHPRYEAMLQFCTEHDELSDYEDYFSSWSAEELANCANMLCQQVDDMMVPFIEQRVAESEEAEIAPPKNINLKQLKSAANVPPVNIALSQPPKMDVKLGRKAPAKLGGAQTRDEKLDALTARVEQLTSQLASLCQELTSTKRSRG